MFTLCPKCGHSPMPADQALPAACPACGVILSKVAQTKQAAFDDFDKAVVQVRPTSRGMGFDASSIKHYLLETPEQVDPLKFWFQVVLLAWFAVWGVTLIAQDYRTGELGASFIHRPLLIFHEAGHVVFRPLGEWMMVLGGTLGQIIMPAILGGALLIKNRDPFGASIGLWLVGVSLLDIAPYMYDALHPQLMLLSGRTGEEGGHDWIYLFSSMGLLPKSQIIGALCHKLGALTVLIAIGWGVRVLRLQHRLQH